MHMRIDSPATRRRSIRGRSESSGRPQLLSDVGRRCTQTGAEGANDLFGFRISCVVACRHAPKAPMSRSTVDSRLNRAHAALVPPAMRSAGIRGRPELPVRPQSFSDFAHHFGQEPRRSGGESPPPAGPGRFALRRRRLYAPGLSEAARQHAGRPGNPPPRSGVLCPAPRRDRCGGHAPWGTGRSMRAGSGIRKGSG